MASLHCAARCCLCKRGALVETQVSLLSLLEILVHNGLFILVNGSIFLLLVQVYLIECAPSTSII